MAILVLLTAVLAGAAEPETSAVLPEAIPGPGSAAMVRFLAWCAASGVEIVGLEFRARFRIGAGGTPRKPTAKPQR